MLLGLAGGTAQFRNAGALITPTLLRHVVTILLPWIFLLLKGVQELVLGQRIAALLDTGAEGEDAATGGLTVLAIAVIIETTALLLAHFVYDDYYSI